MNKIVFEHYPASKLPEEMRGDLSKDAFVRVVIEADEKAVVESRSPFPLEAGKKEQPANLDNLLRSHQAHPERYSGNVTTEEAVARIRELRDEWDDR